MRQVNQLRRILLKSTLVLILLPSVTLSTTKAENSSQAENSSATTGSITEQYLLAAANRERLSRGLKLLRRDPVLAQAAAFHALQMADHADISHEFPGEPDLATRAATAGVKFSLIAENVGEAPDAIVIHDMWMESAGHRENLLEPNVNVAGISVIARDGQLYAVEDFASTVETLSIDQQESTVSSLIETSGIPVANKLDAEAAESAIQAARQTCTMSTGFAGPRRPWFVMRYTAATLTQLPTPLQTRIGSGKYHQAAVGACSSTEASPFTSYSIAVLLYP
jgi:uncharacterized protein YkwD